MTDAASETAQTVAEAVDPAETIDLLQEMVQIPSPYFEEHDCAEFVYEWLDDRGLDPEYHHISESDITEYEGDNVIARIEGTDPDAPTVLLNGHIDTVKLVEAWEEDPCSGRIEDGKLYGQGACDMKGGVAGIMAAFAALAESDVEPRGDVLLTAVVDEEGPYGLGSDRLIRDGLLEDVDAAVFEGALLRLRPKVMTVATIFAGLLPIMFGDGAGSDIMRRIAAPMIGGMATTTLLTLFVIPAVFVIWKRLAVRRATAGRVAAGRAGPGAAPPDDAPAPVAAE